MDNWPQASCTAFEGCRRIASEIVARCELRPVVEVVAPGTLPKTEFKAKRVRDLRAS